MTRTPWYALLNQVYNVYYLSQGWTDSVKSWADETEENRAALTQRVEYYVDAFVDEHKCEPTLADYLLWLSDVAEELEEEEDEPCTPD